MDWRHLGEISHAGIAVYSELKNLCVWVNTNAGMGSMYRSQHELIFVFKLPTAIIFSSTIWPIPIEIFGSIPEATVEPQRKAIYFGFILR